MAGNKDILNHLDTMSVYDVVRAILEGVISFDEVKESGKLDEALLQEISSILATVMKTRRTKERHQPPRGRGANAGFIKKVAVDSECSECFELYDSLICEDREPPSSGSYCRRDQPNRPKSYEKLIRTKNPKPEEKNAPQMLPLPSEADAITQSAKQNVADTVYSALYAPASAGLGRWFKVQVHLYGKADAKRVNKKALAMDKNATLNEYNPLSVNIERGTQVDAEISMYDDGVRVSRIKQSLVWNGEMISTVFQVKSIDPDLSSVAGDLTLSVKGLPVGMLSFNTEIVEKPTDNAPIRLGKAKGYKKAFISYSHLDVETAEITASILHGVGMDFFYDQRNLASGDVFDEEIERNIRESDLFILLWSENAAKSEYVEKEYLYALPFAYPQKPKDEATIDFKPYRIAPYAEAPEKLLKVYHFPKLQAE